jgi:inosose dehydratase
MRDAEIDRIVPGIAAIGYQGLELAVTPRFPTDLGKLDAPKRRHIARLLGAHKLALTAVAAHTSMCEEDPAKHASNMKRLRDAIDLAAELAGDDPQPIMASLVGGREDMWDTHREAVAQRVHALGEYAASRGVVLAVEPHSGTILDLPHKAAWLLETVNHPSVRLNFDISHFIIRGIEIEECVPVMAPWAVHTHVKDQRGLYPHHEFLTPGAGPFDFARCLTALHQAGYTGFIGIEVSFMVQNNPRYDPWVDAALGYYALRHAFGRSGVPLDP